MARQLDVVGEKDSEAFVVASVSALAGCHNQARFFDALMERIQEAIALGLDVQEDELAELDVVGVQRLKGRHHFLAMLAERMALCNQLEPQLSQVDQQRRRLLEALLAEALAAPERALPPGHEKGWDAIRFSR